MIKGQFTRRNFIKGAAAATAIAVGRISIPGRVAEASSSEHKVPHSSGTEAPKLKAPANACDCHLHIYDPRFPPPGPSARLVTNAGVEQYRLLQNRIGTTRAVIVTPSAYATANAVTLDAISQLGLGNARGIAVVRPEVTDAELKKMADGGIRGIRFTLFDPKTAVTGFEMIEPLAKRANDLGWHVQLHFRGDQIVEREDLLKRIVAPIVFDHMGRIPQPDGNQAPRVSGHLPADRQRPDLGQAVGGLPGHEGRPPDVCGRVGSREGISQVCPRANGMGERLAPSYGKGTQAQ